MAKARASHILVESEEKANELLSQINEGADFAQLAQEHSSCPSKAQGGDLGEFGPGMMVPEFDKAIFSNEAGSIVGPVKTQFGYHLISITSRS